MAMPRHPPGEDAAAWRHLEPQTLMPALFTVSYRAATSAQLTMFHRAST